MAGFFQAVKVCSMPNFLYTIRSCAHSTQHLFLPAVIASALYLLCAYVLYPLYCRHRDRYAQYLPLDAISSHTTSLRDRITRSISNFVLHRAGSSRDVGSGWAYDDARRGSSASGDEFHFGEEEGESMVGFDMGRREHVRESRRSTRPQNERRLSRDLEEGFRDESGSEDEHRDERRS